MRSIAGEVQLRSHLGDTAFVRSFIPINLNNYGWVWRENRWRLTQEMLQSVATGYNGNAMAAIDALEQVVPLTLPILTPTLS